jgi:hypothetical protein
LIHSSLRPTSIGELYGFDDSSLTIDTSTNNDRAILHIPFVPFSILFTRTIQLVDFTDLDRLERFAASLQPEAGAESITHPHRLYELLCQAARLYLESSATLKVTNAADVGASVPSYSNDVDFANMGMETESSWMPSDSQDMDLSDWYQGNQEILRMLDVDITF